MHYRSSPQAVRGFCGTCGTSISYEPADNPENIEVTSSIFDDPDRFAPTREIWVSHRLAWEQLDSALPSFQMIVTEMHSTRPNPASNRTRRHAALAGAQR